MLRAGIKFISKPSIRRFSSTAVNVLSKTMEQLKQESQQKGLDKQPEIERLAQFRNQMQQLTDSMVQLNQTLTNKSQPVLTMSQFQSNIESLNLFARNNPDLSERIKANMQNLLVGINSVYVENINNHYFDQNVQAIQEVAWRINAIIYEVEPSRHQEAVLTSYGEQLREKLGAEAFLKAMQLINNQLIEESSYEPMTRGTLDHSMAFDLPIYLNPEQTYVVEKEACISDPGVYDTSFFCKEAQLAFFNQLVNDDKLSDLTVHQLDNFRRYIEARDEVLVDPKHITETSKPQALFYAQNKVDNYQNSEFVL
ncbi:MAG: hypothetical protein EP298_04975 [Gammaproteobacteria bacterium]|nr:MAG: hypothetical protein EP298_04975 [Gammaproteobacteria bacterium]UTW42519.1 hypothetical protein KFE69_13780 [bacterium SCSIO 12844]